MIFTQLASDNFNRADSNDLGANWDDGYAVGYSRFEIVSNTAGSEFDSEGDICIETYNNVALPNDQYAEAVIKQWGQETIGGMLVRAGAPGTLNTYFIMNSSFTGGTVNTDEITKVVSDVWTTLSDDLVSTWAVNDVMKGAVLGTDLYLFKNGVQVLTASDSAHASGRAGLIGLYFSNANFLPRFDDWAAGEVEADGGGSFQAAWAFNANQLIR